MTKKNIEFSLFALLIFSFLSLAYFTVNNVDYSISNDAYIYTHKSWTRLIRVVLGFVTLISGFGLLRLSGGFFMPWKRNLSRERILFWAALIVGVSLVISSITYSKPSLILDSNGFTYETEALFANEKYEIKFNDIYSIDINEYYRSFRHGKRLRIIVNRYSGTDTRIRSGNLFIIALPNFIRLAEDAGVRINDNR